MADEPLSADKKGSLMREKGLLFSKVIPFDRLFDRFCQKHGFYAETFRKLKNLLTIFEVM